MYLKIITILCTFNHLDINFIFIFDHLNIIIDT